MSDLLHNLAKSRVCLEFCQIGFKFIAGHFSALCTITYPGFEPWFLLKRNDPMNFAQNEAMFDIKL